MTPKADNPKLREEIEECWLFAGYKSPAGYGRVSFWDTERKKVTGIPVHRVMYEALVGEIPAGLVIDHLCRVRCCINPSHLEPVTHQTNILRGVGLPAQNAVKTHCSRGHELTPENMYLIRNGKNRNCKTCRKSYTCYRNGVMYPLRNRLAGERKYYEYPV